MRQSFQPESRRKRKTKIHSHRYQHCNVHFDIHYDDGDDDVKRCQSQTFLHLKRK